jgi:hypothetical protein
MPEMTFAREMDWALAIARVIPLAQYFKRWGARRVLPEPK